MKAWRLTHDAEQRILDIALWTTLQFGRVQAVIYRDELIACLDRLAKGESPHAKPCAILMQGKHPAEGLSYYRQGQHFIIMRETAERIDVLDFLHVNSDLPSRIARLSGR